MSKQILFSLLNKASNGNEILEILESLTSEEQNQPTLEEIQF
jgi:hypothetical protein